MTKDEVERRAKQRDMMDAWANYAAGVEALAMRIETR